MYTLSVRVFRASGRSRCTGFFPRCRDVRKDFYWPRRQSVSFVPSLCFFVFLRRGQRTCRVPSRPVALIVIPRRICAIDRRPCLNRTYVPVHASIGFVHRRILSQSRIRVNLEFYVGKNFYTEFLFI